MSSSYGSINNNGGTPGDDVDPPLFTAAVATKTESTVSSSESAPLIDGNGDAAAVAEAAGKKTTTSLDYGDYRNQSLWSKLVFQWFVPVLERGNQNKKLEQDDLSLVPLPYDCTTESVMNQFEKEWEQEKRDSQEKGKDPSLIRALYLAFGADYFRAGFLKLVNDLCTFVGPQVLNQMVLFLRSPNASLWYGLALTLAVTVSQITMSICLRHYFFKVREVKRSLYLAC